MKTRNKVSAIEQFQKSIMEATDKHYRQTLSDNARRAWRLRKRRLSTHKVAM